MRYNISKQIIVRILAVVLAFTGLNIFSFYQFNTIESGYEALVKRSAPLVFEVKDVQAELAAQSSAIRAYNNSGDVKLLAEYDKSLKIMDKSFESLAVKLITTEGKRQLEELKVSANEYHKAVDVSVKMRKEKGAVDAAQYNGTLNAAFDKTENIMKSYEDFLIKRMDQRVDENKKHVSLIHTMMFILTGVILVFAVGMAWYLARKISKPLQSVVGAAQRIANGELHQVEINYNGNDEIGDLAKSFTVMTGQLRSLIMKVTTASEQVAASSEELTASAEQSAQASQQVAQTVTDVAGSTSAQLQSVEHTVQVVRQMSMAIDHIAKNAEAVSVKSTETAKAAEAGKQIVDQADAQMKSINQAVSQSAAVMQKLGNSSKQIGQIVDVITGIAGQTNLLALNAAIEAARAGEQGRGFAVVAEEVRKLAEQSHQAALQIAELISYIQKETENAVTAMNKGTREVDEGTKIIELTGERFVSIVLSIDGLTTQIQEISAATEELAASSDDVVNSVDSVKDAASMTAGNTQTISAAAEEQSASMEEIASSSQLLSRLAEDLQKVIGEFKV